MHKPPKKRKSCKREIVHQLIILQPQLPSSFYLASMWRVSTSHRMVWACVCKSCMFAFCWISFIPVSVTAGCECVWMNAQRLGRCLFFVTHKHELSLQEMVIFLQSQVLGCSEMSQLTHSWSLAHVLCYLSLMTCCWGLLFLFFL